MMIEISDDYGDGEAVTIDTDTADRETLAEALIRLHKQWDWLDKAWDKRAETLTGNGLDFRDTKNGAYLDVIDPPRRSLGCRRRTPSASRNRSRRAGKPRSRSLRTQTTDPEQGVVCRAAGTPRDFSRRRARGLAGWGRRGKTANCAQGPGRRVAAIRANPRPANHPNRGGRTMTHEAALASIIDADPNRHGGALTLVYFGIVAIEPVLADIVTGKPELVVDLVHGMKRGDLASDDCFDRLVELALKLEVVVAVQNSGINQPVSPAALPCSSTTRPPRFQHCWSATA